MSTSAFSTRYTNPECVDIILHPNSFLLLLGKENLLNGQKYAAYEFVRVPMEIVLNIMGYLDYKDLARMEVTNRYYNQILTVYGEHFWQKQLIVQFNVKRECINQSVAPGEANSSKLCSKDLFKQLYETRKETLRQMFEFAALTQFQESFRLPIHRAVDIWTRFNLGSNLNVI